MNEYNQAGNWPANAIYDVKNMRDELRENGCEDADFVFVAHYKVLRELEYTIPNSGISYRDWLLNQGILYAIFMDNTLNEDEGYLYATRKGIPFFKPIEELAVVPNNSPSISTSSATHISLEKSILEPVQLPTSKALVAVAFNIVIAPLKSQAPVTVSFWDKAPYWG